MNAIAAARVVFFLFFIFVALVTSSERSQARAARSCGNTLSDCVSDCAATIWHEWTDLKAKCPMWCRQQCDYSVSPPRWKWDSAGRLTGRDRTKGAANAGNGGPPAGATAINDSLHKGRAPAAPAKPDGMKPASTDAVRETSGTGIPKTKIVNGKPTACFGYNSAHVLIPVDCGSSGPQYWLIPPPLGSKARPTVGYYPGDPPQPIEPVDPSLFPLLGDTSSPSAAPSTETGVQAEAPSSATSQPSPQQAAIGSNDTSGELQLPMSTAQLQDKINECSSGANSERCKCPWAPSKAPTISPYSCGGGEDTVCGIEPLLNKQRQSYDPDKQWSYSRCYEKCTAKLVDYNKQANSYNALSKQRCPRTYADD